MVARQHLLNASARADRLAGDRSDHVARRQPGGSDRSAAPNAGDRNAGGAGAEGAEVGLLTGRDDLYAEKDRRADVDGRGNVTALNLAGDRQRRVDRDRERLHDSLLARARRPVVTRAVAQPAERITRPV